MKLQHHNWMCRARRIACSDLLSVGSNLSTSDGAGGVSVLLRLLRLVHFLLRNLRTTMSFVTSALLIIDIQNDYFSGGSMELFRTDETAIQARKLLDHFRATDRPVVHVQHVSLEHDAEFFIPDTYGACINELVAPLSSEPVS